MKLLSVGIENNNMYIKEMLEARASILNGNRKYRLVGQESIGTATFYRYEIDTESMAEIIGEIIFRYMRDRLLKQIIENSYYYFDQKSRDDIWQRAVDKLRFQNMVMSFSLQDSIVDKLKVYFNTADEVLVDGFIRFRLKDEIMQLINAVEDAVNDILMEREYNEFIRLLRYFVEIQEPKVEEVHVIVEPGNNYKLMDENMHAIDNAEMIEEMAKEMSNKMISSDDILISSLITMAPNKIILHNVEYMTNLELLNTINNVFYGKVNIVLNKN